MLNYLYGLLIAAGLLVGAYWMGGHNQRVKDAAEVLQVKTADKVIADNLQQKLLSATGKTETVTQTIIKRVPYAVNHYIPAPGAATQVRPDWFLTRYDVRLLNHALLADTAPGTVEASPGPGDLELTGISETDLQTNVVTNYGQYAQCREIAQGWQDYWRQISKANSHKP